MWGGCLFTFFTFAHILDLVVSYSFKLRRLIFCFQCYIVKTIDTFQTAAPPPFLLCSCVLWRILLRRIASPPRGFKFSTVIDGSALLAGKCKRQIFPLFRVLKEDLMIKSVDISVHIIFCAYLH